MNQGQPKIKAGETYYHKRLELFVKVLKVDGVYALYEREGEKQGIKAQTHITNLESIQESAQDDR